MPEPSAPPVPPKPNSILDGLNPDELFARGMQSVRITGANGLANWEPPTLEEAARLFPKFTVLEIIGRGAIRHLDADGASASTAGFRCRRPHSVIEQ